MSGFLTLRIIGLMVFCIVTEAAREMCFKHAANNEAFRAALVKPITWFGIMLWGMELVSWIMVLEQVPLSLAYPMMALGYVVIVAAGAVIMKERVTLRHGIAYLSLLVCRLSARQHQLLSYESFMKYYIGLTLLLLTGCTAPQGDDPFEARDPLQPVNQKVFAFNVVADRYVIRPAAQGYHYLPLWSRVGIDNFLTNLSEPSNVVNSLLQLDPEGTLTSFWRFTLNTTFGMAGLRDFAGENGLKDHPTDFGRTLGRYGVPKGAYVVLPVMGPSTLRDTAGQGVDWFLDPVGWVLTTPAQIAQAVVDGVNTRDQQSGVIDRLYYQSLSPYVSTRATYLQHEDFLK